MKHYLIEIDAYNLATLATETVYFSDKAFNTTASDTPANVSYIARATQPFSIRRNLFNGDRIGGRSVPASGELVLLNNDGALDYLTDYSFNTRQFRIYQATYVEGGQPRSNFTKIYQGVTEQLEFSEDTISIKLRDRLYVFDKPLQTNLYGTSGVNTVEGQPKPLVFGRVQGIRPTYTNTSTRTFQVNDGAYTSVVVRDRGVVLTAGVNYSEDGAGSFTLTGVPAGVIECDSLKNSPYTSTSDLAAVFQWIVRDYAGLSVGDIDTASFAALPSNPQVGVYINAETKIVDVLDFLATTIGAFYYFDRDDKLTIGRFDLPESIQTADATIDTIKSLNREQTAIPVWSVVYGYSKRYTTLTQTDLAGSVSQFDASLFSQEQLTKKSEDSTIKTPYPNARRLEYDSAASVSEAIFAQAEANRLLVLYRDQRDVFKMEIAADPFTFELAQTIQIVQMRYSFEFGRNFRIVEITDVGTSDLVSLTLWGPGRGILLLEDGANFLFEDGSGFFALET